MSAVVVLPMVDDPPNPTYVDTLQSGIFFLDGRRKPSYAAFRFPFVTQRLGRDRVMVWGNAPLRGRVLIQRRLGGAMLRAVGRGVAGRPSRVPAGR